MLPARIVEPVTLAERPPLPVGRKYALRFLYGVEGNLPMPDVDIEMVRQHCGAALRQTILRDFAAIATVVTAALVAPWSTLITIALLAAVILLAKRARFKSPLTIAALAGAAVALIGDWRRAQESYAVPLVCLGVFVFIYFADIFWSLRRVRHLSRMPSVPPVAVPPPRNQLIVMPFEPPPTLTVHAPAASANGHQSAADENSATRVYYDKNGIIGAGTSVESFRLTIPIDKPLDIAHEITSFTAAELQDYVARHISSQGVGDERAHGYARRPASPDGHDSRPAVHFTYGLPYLLVDKVTAGPLPADKKHPILPIRVYSLQPGQLPIQDRSPSVHPDRTYTRVITASWDGQLVVSLYVSAALQGHFLRMVIRPYVLAPIISELKAVDDLVARNAAIRAFAAVRITALQFSAGAARLRGMTGRERNRGKYKDPRPAARSTRERYAQLRTENMHQRDDEDRIIKVVELKIATATMEYLKSRNIATGEYETQVIFNIESQVIGGGTINSGTFTNSPVTNVSGQGNTTTTTTAGARPPA
jgi:hypothetical protein